MVERLGATPLTLERYLLGELSAAAQAELERALGAAQCAALRAEDAQLRAQLLRQLPEVQLRERVLVRAARDQAGRRAARWTGAAAGALLALVGVLAVLHEPASEPVAAGVGERAKGLAPALHVYRRRGAAVERVDPGALLRAHDLLQLGYLAAGRGYGVLLSIDGAAGVTLHQPASPELGTALVPGGGEQLLPSAYELDAAPGFERFFWVVSAQPLDAAAVLAAARRLVRDPARAAGEPLALPPGAEQYSLLFPKESH